MIIERNGTNLEDIKAALVRYLGVKSYASLIREICIFLKTFKFILGDKVCTIFLVFQLILDTNKVTKEPDINTYFFHLFLEKTTSLVKIVSIITDFRFDA